MIRRCKEIIAACFEGDVTMSKVTLWLLAAACLSAGVVYGLKKAPWTHGVTIGCNNGNQGNCVYGNTGDGEDEEEK